MKKVIITAIILINCITLYFWAFPYQNKQDLYVLKLTDKALRTQSEIIGNRSANVIKSTMREVELYPKFEFYEERVKEIHELTRSNYSIIQGLRDSMISKFPEKYFIKLYDNTEEAFALKNRIRPFYYRIPKRVMCNHWAEASVELARNQAKMLELIKVDSFKQIAKDSILLNIDALSELFKNVDVMEALSLLSGIQTQIRSVEYHLLTHLLIEIKKKRNKEDFQKFVPMVYGNTHNLKIGDTYEAEIFAAAYLKSEYTKVYADNKEIPIENGIAIYSVKPTSVGKKKVNIRMEVTNPIHKKIEMFKKQFGYDVVNCD